MNFFFSVVNNAYSICRYVPTVSSATSTSEVSNGGIRSTRCHSLKQKKTNIFSILITIRTDSASFCKKKVKLTKWWDLEQKITIFTKKIALLVRFKLFNLKILLIL